MMFYDKFYGSQDHFWGWKCIICGEIFDQIILENRMNTKDGRARRVRNGEMLMITKEGEMLKNKLTRDLYKVKKIEDTKVILENELVYVHIYTLKRKTWESFMRE